MKTTRLALRLVGLASLMCSTAARVDAHGTNIAVQPVNNKLIVSGGLADSNGFAPMVFVEDDEDGVRFGESNLSGFGMSGIWQIPGFWVTGVDLGSGLYLDVLTRPFAHSSPANYRTLWYSDTLLPGPDVDDAPLAHPLQVRKTSAINTILNPNDGTDPAPFQIAAPAAADLGPDKHLVGYALRYDTSNPESPVDAPAGAYGFFARLTSNIYAPSDPFLIVLNNGIDNYSQMVPAALAINAAAFLPGDYNHDDRVDAADYTVWRKTLGSSTALAADGSGNQLVDQADFTVWRQNFGAAVTGSGSGVSVSNVPEPSGWGALASGVISLLGCLNRGLRTPHKSLQRA